METKFKGKAIYNPSGKAGEYSSWACNFYTGCSNGCTYCYLKKGQGKAILGGDKPVLKKCFKNESHALDVFEKELKANLTELQEHGLLFSFSTDPMLDETIILTYDALGICIKNDVPVKILTKCAKWVGVLIQSVMADLEFHKNKVAFGFTLTGQDELEPRASLNMERVRAMARLHNAGFKTFASIEPIIDIPTSLAMINLSHCHCDLYKVGLESGKKYAWQDLRGLMLFCYSLPVKFYFKDSFLKQAGIARSNLPENCVNRDYSLFEK